MKSFTKSRGPSEAVKRDSQTAKRLHETLRRAKPEPIPESLRLQFLALVKLALKELRGGRKVISPTVKAIGQASGIKVRQARNNLRIAEDWGFLIPYANSSGGYRSAQWEVSGEALFRKLVERGCNPSLDLRKGLRVLEPTLFSGESRTFINAVTPALTPAVETNDTPAFAPTITTQNQWLNWSRTAPEVGCGKTPALTPAVQAGICEPIHMDRPNASPNQKEFSQYTGRSRVRTSLSLEPTHPHSEKIGGLADRKAGHDDEPWLEASHHACPRAALIRNGTRKQHTGETDRDALQAIAFPPPSPLACPVKIHESYPSQDARTLLTHLERSGPSSYGAAASDLGWGNTRAWQAEAVLQAAGAIWHDPIGRMVPNLTTPESDPAAGQFLDKETKK